MTLDDVEPARLYGLSTFCALVPSCQQGKRLHLSTAQRLCLRGKLEGAVKRQDRWFVPGRTVLAWAAVRPAEGPVLRPERRRRRDQAAALNDLRAMGLKV